jgi:hypothetical protein
LQSRVNKLVYYSRNKHIGAKMKNKIFCVVHSFSRFLAGGFSRQKPLAGQLKSIFSLYWQKNLTLHIFKSTA